MNDLAEPKWKLVANLGDVNPLDYGGYFIFDDETGEDCPYAELLIEPCDGTAHYEVYRFSLDRCKMKKWTPEEPYGSLHGYLVPFAYETSWPHPAASYKEWFADDVASVAAFIGSTEGELQGRLCSDDLMERAIAYRAIGDYLGFSSLDSHPLRLTRKEARERYAGFA